MTIEQLTKYILETFPGSDFVTFQGDVFYYADKSLVGSKTIQPFATIVTKDSDYDKASNLDRDEDTYRFNLGLNKSDFDSLIAVQPPSKEFGAYLQTDIDFTVEDQIIPHPIYGTANWISVINPSKLTIDKLKQYMKKGFNNQLAQMKA